ncbi:hypothetical protein LOK49_LG02G03142 [Camellia lanceoleosa]|uniref:Uncharacterized protein n=1 Tax=Camellia lanceoleosa TaxID=1840588 RepID=A0ACC0IS35_9ERIC|nr:hypothetical protein LOK49_LG02G03142 [Camellia lanceoleosa]
MVEIPTPSSSFSSAKNIGQTPQLEGQKQKSFKDALAAPKHNDFYFDENMDSLLADEEDAEGDTHIHDGGPWVIMDHYLTVRKWTPDFKTSEAFETTTAVWVRFSELPIEYFHEQVLYVIAKQIGKPLKIDLTTAIATRGRFARVCIEVDLHKPLCP